MARVGLFETENKVKKAMQDVKIPCTVSYIEKTVGMNYRTAYKMLNEMIKRGSVKILKTTANDLYVLSDWKPDFLNAGKT
jgi:predicted transcriptional regulator